MALFDPRQSHSVLLPRVLLCESVGMKPDPAQASQPLIAQIQKLFSRDLTLENDYLRQENRILRGKFGQRVPLTDGERRILVRCGMRIRDRLGEVASIVKPETILRWNRRMKQMKWTYDNRPKKPGRPPKGKQTEELVVRLAEDNGTWGYTRIAGELRKLGHKVSPSCVRDILKEHGIPPCPQRKGMSWKQFIQSHMDLTWATDLFTEEVWTLSGLVTCYVLFFIHLGTRRVFIAGCTPHPESVWMSQQARNFCMIVDDSGEKCRYLIHDRDTVFLPFDTVLATEDLRIVKTPPRTPLCNAFAERHVRECRETLDSMILIGERHLQHVLKKIEHHHNLRRPHQGLRNAVPMGFEYPEDAVAPAEVQCESVLGGLLNHYRAAKAA